MKLLNNSGTEAFREIAFKLKDDGVTEEEYKNMLKRVLPGWFNDEDMKERIRTLLDILFYTTLFQPKSIELAFFSLYRTRL